MSNMGRKVRILRTGYSAPLDALLVDSIRTVDGEYGGEGDIGVVCPECIDTHPDDVDEDWFISVDDYEFVEDE